MIKLHGSRLIRNSIFNLFNSIFTIGETVLISIWVARQLGPEQYGIFNNVLWLTSSFTWMIGMGFTHVITKFIAEYTGRGEGHYASAIILFVLKIEVVLSLVLTAICLFFRVRIADYFFSPNESFYYMIAFIGLLPGILTAIFSAAIEGIQKFEYFTLANLIITPFSFICKIIVLSMGKGMTGLLCVMLIFSFINAIFYLIILFKERTFASGCLRTVAPDLRKRMLNYNANIIPILMCDKIIWDKSENFFLGRLCSGIQIAYFNLGYNIARRFTSILPETFWRVLFPAMSQHFGAGDIKKTERLFFITTRYLAFIAFPVGLAGILSAYQLINYMYGHDYIGAQHPLQIIFFCSMITSLTKPASAILYGYGRQSFIYKYGIILAIVNITLDIFLIKPYGATGAAVCYAITTILGAVGGLLYTCRIMKLRYPFVSIFKILFSTIIMGIAMEITLLRIPDLLGFIISIGAGFVVYGICALVLGTFEEEDTTLLESIQHVLPGKKLKGILSASIAFLLQFKNNR